ncbi:hypothetical protein BJ138DRAFT_1147093 [Hygrophoropsis aurantiaca]|uniref:Uncharacterized protein n=1 Tax=Hygrophoropsis aurantiaca TaxID=72124 RepID=A0ACB8AI99_9AGAM|nr:hypothetical protein BJ138DRAFT_1147093 [Hygrophoropsis aurantiaca]
MAMAHVVPRLVTVPLCEVAGVAASCVVFLLFGLPTGDYLVRPSSGMEKRKRLKSDCGLFALNECICLECQFLSGTSTFDMDVDEPHLMIYLWT